MIDITRHIKKARQIHGDWYDYSHITNPNIRYTDKVTIVCPEHGPFEQTLNSHHKGSGCPNCGREKHTRKRIADINKQLDKCKKTHNHKYDYSLVTENVRALDKIDIICPEHGIFKQRLNDHYNGHGCPVCASEQRTTTNKKGKQHFVAKARLVHGNLYNYDLVPEDVELKQKTTIWCDQHGYFTQTFDSHLVGNGCPYCTRQQLSSKGERQITELIQSQGIETINNSRTIISPYELDIFLPDYNIAIEYCGLYWHSETCGKHRLYHKQKLDMCNQQGIRLITIFEDEWIHKPQIVSRKILSVLNRLNQETVYARNTTINHVTKQQRKDFFQNNHIQGDGPGSITYGLYHKKQLVACCSFSRKNKNDFYLTRYATSCNVVGGFSKLVTHFIKNHQCDQLISFADLRWSNGAVYEQTGWTLDSIIPPDYTYVTRGVQREHKFGYRRRFLPKKLDNFDPQLSEKQNCDNNGLMRIWDCGKLRYVFIPK